MSIYETEVDAVFDGFSGMSAVKYISSVDV